MRVRPAHDANGLAMRFLASFTDDASGDRRRRSSDPGCGSSGGAGTLCRKMSNNSRLLASRKRPYSNRNASYARHDDDIGMRDGDRASLAALGGQGARRGSGLVRVAVATGRAVAIGYRGERHHGGDREHRKDARGRATEGRIGYCRATTHIARTRRWSCRGRNDPSSVDSGRPPHRSERALLTHSAPTLGVWRENDHQATGVGSEPVAATGPRVASSAAS